MGASDTLRRMKPISTEPTVRRAPRWPRLPAASKNHTVLSSSQAQLANRCAVQGQGIRTTLGPSGSNIREARSQLPALGDGVRAKWEPDCRDGTCVCVFRSGGSSRQLREWPHGAQLPRWPPQGYPAKSRGSRDKAPAEGSVESSRGIPSTLPSPQLPFEPFFGFTHTTWENC